MKIGNRMLGTFFSFLFMLSFASCEKKRDFSEDDLQNINQALEEAKKVPWRQDTIEKESQKIYYDHLESLQNLRDLEEIGSDKWNYYNEKVSTRLISLMVDLEEEFGKENRDEVQAFILKKYFGVTL